LLQPYRPGRDIQTDAIRALHPTYDGRGVTVAVVDGTPDFLVPELRDGKTLDGTDVAKFVDIRTGESPISNNEFTPWLTTQSVQAIKKQFTVGSVTYTTPYDGIFRFVAVSSQKGYRLLWSVVDSDTKPAKSDVLFGILWDERSNAVWVDTNRNRNFDDERELHDYHINHEYATFAIKTNDPNARPTIGFVVQTDRVSQKLALLFGLGEHPTGVAGSIAANREDGGRMEGIAPDARLYSIAPPNLTASAITEAVIEAARSSLVDVIDVEFTSALSYAPHDGRFTESVIFDRVTRRYGKAIFQPADNEFGMSRIADSCVPSTVFCIGAYENHDSYLINAGIDVPHWDNLHFIDAFGPAGDGGLKPDVLAPSGWLSLLPGFEKAPQRKGVFNLPPGYWIFGGTSQAAPTAAGAAAVLISAAYQEHLRVTPERLMRALSYTARYLPNLPAYMQGNGLIQIGSALQWLELGNEHPLIHLAFNAPIHTVTSWSLPTPNRGVGLFEREGWIAGMRGIRTVWITRKDGPSMPEPIRIELVGNDGTFAIGRTLLLPLGRPVPVVIHIAPQQSGAHSAILRLHAVDGTIIGETLLTIVASEQLIRQDAYTITRHVVVPRPGGTSIFVAVPRRTQALVVRIVSKRRGSNLHYVAWQADSAKALNISNNLLTEVPLSAGIRQDVFPHPQPGTWELLFKDASDEFDYETRHVRPTPITVMVSLVGASATKKSGALLFRSRRATVPTLTMIRQTAGAAMYMGVIQAGEQRIYGIHVPQDATGIGAVLQGPIGSFINLYLFDCTKSSSKKCTIITKSTETSSHQYLYYDRPAGGLWKLVVDGYGVSSRGTPYQLQDYYLEGLPSANSCDRHAVPVATFGTLGNDPGILYNLNPIVFDVQFLAAETFQHTGRRIACCSGAVC
jgi:subtilisin family serine protease